MEIRTVVDIDADSLVEDLVTFSPEEIVEFIVKIDEMMCDWDFTNDLITKLTVDLVKGDPDIKPTVFKKTYEDFRAWAKKKKD
jgi:hypothetical protein